MVSIWADIIAECVVTRLEFTSVKTVSIILVKVGNECFDIELFVIQE
jgi:hypothetical protein